MNISSFDDDTVADCYAAVDTLASDFLARYRDGDRPSIEDYARRHPGLSDEIRRMFPLIASVEKLKIDQQVSHDGTATLAGRQLQRLGDFRIIREIGRGGMGIVFEAEQESLGRSVAIKVLPKQCLLDDAALARFHQEARMAAAMHHSNIVPVFGTGETDGSHYLVMQLVGGESLDKNLAGLNAPMPVHQVARIGEQLAEAIAYAHENGVLHRDIKPANILLEEDGTAQVTDFGLARNLTDDPTTTRTLSGSLRYMAPERFRGLSDERSDVYSIGLTLFEMAAGQPAFTQEDPDQLIRSMTNPTVTSLRRIRPDLSIDLETIVLKAIHPEPNLRYPTASALADDLRRFLADEPIQARRISKLQRCSRWCRRNPKIASAIGVTAVSLIATTIVSTAAYVATSAANQRTLAALKESEQSLNLAVQSLDGVVEVISIASSVAPVEINSNDEAAPDINLTDISFSPSPYSAHLLERIQPLYERLAQQAPTRPDIILQMVDASIQLARIQNQLGRTSAAFQTLEDSINVLNARAAEAQVSASEKSLRLGRLFNELGTVRLANLDTIAADTAFEEALGALDAVLTQTPQIQLESVRAHLALGSLSPSNRRRGQLAKVERTARSNHITTALETLDRLPEPESTAKSAQILRARSFLAMSRLVNIPETKRDHFNTAVTLLRQQLKRTPTDAAIRFELVQVLGDVNVRRDQTRRQMMVSKDRLDEALSELGPLKAQYPGISTFLVAEVHLWHKLSSIARSRQRFDNAEQQLQRAIKIQSDLVDATPDRVVHRCWRALLYRSLAECEREQDHSAAATAALEFAMQDLNAISSDSNNHPFVIRTREMISSLQQVNE